MAGIQFDLSGNIAAAVQFLSRSSSLANALGNNNSVNETTPPESNSYSVVSHTVTATSTASNHSPSNSDEYKNGPTPNERAALPTASDRVGDGQGSALSGPNVSTSKQTDNPSTAPADFVASLRQSIPGSDPLNIGNEQPMELDSDMEEPAGAQDNEIPRSFQTTEIQFVQHSNADGAVEPRKRPSSQTRTASPAESGSSADSTAKRVRFPSNVAVDNSPTTSSSSLNEAEAFLDSVANNISSTSLSSGDEPNHRSDVPAQVESSVEMVVDPHVGIEGSSSSHDLTTSKSEREARIWDGEHPTVENANASRKVRRASRAWENKGPGELNEPPPVEKDHPTANAAPSDNPTSTTSDVINTPGIWALHAGLNTLGFLPTEFVLDENISSRVRLWRQQPRDHVITSPADASFPLIVYLFCLPVAAVQAVAENVPAELESEVWVSTAYGDGCMKRAERDGACVWPERGLCIEVNGKAAGVIGGKVRKGPVPSSPLDISRYILPGRNIVRLVQLQDFSSFVFVLFCREAREEELTRRAPKPRNMEDEATQKVRNIAKRARERMRRERKGRSAGITHATTSARAVALDMA